MKNPNLKLRQQENPSPVEAVLLKGIQDHAKVAKGLQPLEPFAISINDEQEQIVGGVTGCSFYGCLHVDLLWVDPKLRNQGIGSKLMQEAQELGKTRHCLFTTVNTMDWEALPFYQKLGYKIEFSRSGFDKNSTFYMLRKTL